MLRCATAPTIPHMDLSFRLFSNRPAYASIRECSSPFSGFFLYRPYVTAFADLRFPVQHELVFSNDILPPRRPRPDRRATRHAHGRDELRVRANEHIVFDHRAEFVRAIVITGDRARANIHARADIRIADITQMIRLRAAPEHRVFHFHEVADMRFVAEHRAWPQTRVRSEHDVRAGRAAFNMRERINARAVANRSIADL